MRPEPQDRTLQALSPRAAPTDTSGSDQTSGRRLGRFEYLLLALIVLGVAITLVMAVIDPSG
ncbi:MAG: hypothetical protein ACJ780_21740 [Solirubrobacteraceae bacterium]